MIRLHLVVRVNQDRLRLVGKNLWKMLWVFCNLALSRAAGLAS